jgi:hypothetical protein
MTALFAQTDAPPQPGWRKFGPPVDAARPDESITEPPSRLALPAGAWLTVHVNERLSSDHNQPGDAFTATLAQPLIAGGFVIARRGQTVCGRVVEAQKAVRGKGNSRLGLELTEIELVYGQHLPVHTQFIERRGGSSTGRDVAVVGTTTGVGAVIGAAADGGFGAGMGAIAGAAAGVAGVLLTPGKPTEVYPEMMLTFRSLDAQSISTVRGEQAFEPVQQTDYEPQMQQRLPPPPAPVRPPAVYYSAYPAPYYYSPYYYSPYAYGPGWYGPSLYYYSGPRGYYRRGYRR